MEFPTKVSEFNGNCMTAQKIVPGNTATGISSNVYEYYERTLAYTSGGTTEIKAGDVLVGATSSAVAIVKSLTLTSGTWAGGDAAGTFTLKCQVGTFQSENVKVGAGTNDATVGGNSTAVSTYYGYKGAKANKLLIEVLSNTALIAFDGSTPDQTYKLGLQIPANGTLELFSLNDMRNFKVIDAVSGSASTIIIKGMF